MNIEAMLKLGAEQFSKSNLSGDAGSNLDINSIVSALTGLLAGDGDLDFGALMSKFDVGALSEIAASWLGDGGNMAISPEQIMNVLGSDKIGEFASQLGLSTSEAAGGLSEAIPSMMDKASSGGSLLDSVGGVQGALNLAGKLFG